MAIGIGLEDRSLLLDRLLFVIIQQASSEKDVVCVRPNNMDSGRVFGRFLAGTQYEKCSAFSFEWSCKTVLSDQAVPQIRDYADVITSQIF